MYKRKLICCTFFMSEGEENLTLRGKGSGGGNPRKFRKKFTRKRKWKAEIRVTPEKLAGAPKKWYFIL